MLIGYAPSPVLIQLQKAQATKKAVRVESIRQAETTNLHSWVCEAPNKDNECKLRAYI